MYVDIFGDIRVSKRRVGVSKEEKERKNKEGKEKMRQRTEHVWCDAQGAKR